MGRDHPDGKEWITVGEAARRLGLSPDTVRRRADAGRIRSRRTDTEGRGWRLLSAAAVAAYRSEMDR